MVAMNPKLVVTLLFCASLSAAIPAHAKTVLPDACGDDKAQFDVKTAEGQPAPAAPPAGKAQIIFVDDDSVKTSGFSFTTFRYGMDGAWVGANKGNSYFVLNVDPGVHHLCMSPQTVSGKGRMTVGITSFTAEADKIYYFDAQLSMVGGARGTYVPPVAGANGVSTPGRTVGGSPGVPSIDFVQLDDDTGKYRVKAWKLSSWKTK
jgi:hypothetical protein